MGQKELTVGHSPLEHSRLKAPRKQTSALSTLLPAVLMGLLSSSRTQSQLLTPASPLRVLRSAAAGEASRGMLQP